MTPPSIDDVLGQFERNRRSVADLVHFDEVLIELVLASLTSLNERWRTHLSQEHGLTGETLDNHRLTATRQIQLLSNVRDNASLKIKFRAIQNLALVSLVSFFGSAARDLFHALVANSIGQPSSPLKTREVKVSIADMMNDANHASLVASSLEESEKLSFQDMKSMGRAFKLVLPEEVERNATVNDIIVAQACRHALVHADGRVDARLLNQIRDADPRTLKVALAEGETIEFTPEEIELAGTRMTEYFKAILAISRQPA